MAEAIQAFRGRELDDADLDLADGSVYSLATYDDASLGPASDLDYPTVLLAEGWRPSWVASRDRIVTQAMAVRIHEAGGMGLSWWSTLDAAWTNVTLFAERTIAPGLVAVAAAPERLSVRHEAVVAAAEHLAIPLVRRRRRRSGPAG